MDGKASPVCARQGASLNLLLKGVPAVLGVGLLVAGLSCDQERLAGLDSNLPPDLLSSVPGRVKWWWWSDPEEQGIIITAPVVRFEGGREVAYAAADYPNHVICMAVDGPDTAVLYHGLPVVPREESIFVSHPAWCEATGHLVIGNEDGELYAFNGQLGQYVWRYPGCAPDPDSLSYICWGAPAVCGDRIYCTRDNDSLYALRDLGDSVRFEAALLIPWVGSVVAVDDDGCVFATSDSGYLYKLDPDLNQEWRALLMADAWLFPPVLDNQGAVYVGSDNWPFLHAVDASSGAVLWSEPLDGGVYWTAVGRDAVFCATGLGSVHSLDPATGDVNWSNWVSDGEILAGPLLASNGFLYCADDYDRLFCLRQSDGYLSWSCNCESLGPPVRDAFREARGRRYIEELPAALGITSQGDVFLPGLSAAYLVTGFPRRSLDPVSAWPKWQRDQYNTGRMP